MPHRSPSYRSIARAIALPLLLLPCLAAPARAVVSVLPGQSAELGGSDAGGGADGGSVACEISGVGVSCLLGFGGSTAEPADNYVAANFGQYVGSGLGEPHVATARIRDDFAIPGSPDSFVWVQISVSYDLYVSLLGSAAYESAGELSLVVDDVTTGAAEGVGAVSLFRQDRSGDQGFTDVTTGREAYVIEDARDSLRLLLRRGRTYRVWFQAEAMGEQFILGESQASTEATRRRMVVRVDEDEVELLATHDADVKEQLATHDEDVKEQLDRIEAKIDAIDEKLSLVLKTQLEQTLVAPNESRLTVLYTDRLGEVCDAAQEAIDDSEGLGYWVRQQAQRMVDRALGLAESDPKQAVALCRNAYQGAAFPHVN